METKKSNHLITSINARLLEIKPERFSLFKFLVTFHYFKVTGMYGLFSEDGSFMFAKEQKDSSSETLYGLYSAFGEQRLSETCEGNFPWRNGHLLIDGKRTISVSASKLIPPTLVEGDNAIEKDNLIKVNKSIIELLIEQPDLLNSCFDNGEMMQEGAQKVKK